MNYAGRLVAEDSARERGVWSPGAFLWRVGIRPAVNANAYANADANAYANVNANADANVNANADANANANANADADVNADVNAYVNADADVNAYVNADAKPISAFSGGEHVRNGFFVWAQPNGGVVVLRLGWLRRVEGDEYEALNLVTPLRAGDYKTMLADLALDGPPKNWTFTRPIPGACPLNRFHILGPVPLQPSQWEKVCPRPKGWE